MIKIYMYDDLEAVIKREEDPPPKNINNKKVDVFLVSEYDLAKGVHIKAGRDAFGIFLIVEGADKLRKES